MKLLAPFITLGAVALAACDPPPPAPLLDFPADVDRALPIDVDRTEVNQDPDGCWFYTYAGDLFTVNDQNGTPICTP
ncbi:hypothetical protein [Aestuariibius sp. HNIBRBA575]|uniref:hypothetical protein n=1 Tax=Aestuariibius sp. HNIBRBA575 TaxID=3233343 RepID=UPI0034A40AA8